MRRARTLVAALCQRRFGTDDERNERKKRFGGETPTDAIRVLPRQTGTAAPGAPGAHLSAFHRGSRPKECFIARDSAPGFCFLGRGRTGFAYPFERALPAPACPSPARPSRPGRSARRRSPNAARERVASPRAGTALARAAWNASRPRPNHRARFGVSVTGIGTNVKGDVALIVTISWQATVGKRVKFMLEEAMSEKNLAGRSG